MSVQIPNAVKVTQKDWRFCRRCFGLFFDGDPHHNGFCPHPNPPGGAHQALGWEFYLLSDPANPANEPPGEPN